VRRELVLDSSCGDPVLEWWRPGGTDLAIIGQGLQAYLSLPPRCVGVSELKQRNKAHLKARYSARMKGMVRDATRVAERATTARLTKDPPVTDGVDGRGNLGQAVGAQGVLIQPE
jgi:hypothetical protein